MELAKNFDVWTKSTQLWCLLTFEPVDRFSNFKKVNWPEFWAQSVGLRLDPDPDHNFHQDPDLHFKIQIPQHLIQVFDTFTEFLRRSWQLLLESLSRGSKVEYFLSWDPKFWTKILIFSQFKDVTLLLKMGQWKFCIFGQKVLSFDDS